ncbi:hypothetical protein C8J55DRAFT_490997 [Lentinula edodes]|uniref:Uncharacterized protein n=1 Tax=Lentinula lateritia TaxID=40482 RepID=A0A9W9A3M2_9AGAR|nr:hypothetical protein C8J55DRAFT_490997 [Lentinula edodes]
MAEEFFIPQGGDSELGSPLKGEAVVSPEKGDAGRSTVNAEGVSNPVETESKAVIVEERTGSTERDEAERYKGRWVEMFENLLTDSKHSTEITEGIVSKRIYVPTALRGSENGETRSARMFEQNQNLRRHQQEVHAVLRNREGKCTQKVAI